MASSKTNQLIVTAILLSLMLASCQKGSPRSLSKQLGKGATETVSAADKKLNDAIGSDKTIRCSDKFNKNLAEVDTQVAALIKKTQDLKDQKLSEVQQKEIADLSVSLKTKSDLVVNELVDQGVAGCKNQKTIFVLDLKNKINSALIAAADLAGENGASKIARQEKKRLDGIKANDSLVNHSYSLTAELISAFSEESLTQKVHFTGGQIARGQSDLDILNEDRIRTFCFLNTALTKKIKDNSKMTILDLRTSTFEKPFDQDSQKIIKLSELNIRLSLEDQIISMTCPLAKTAKLSDTEIEFRDVFGELIQ